MMRFSPVCVYVPGKQLVVANALSQKPLTDTGEHDLEEDISAHIDHGMSSKSMTDTRLQQVKDQMRDDPVLRAVIVYTVLGRPKYQRDVSEDHQSYFAVQNQLSVCDGLLSMGSRIILPSSMRQEILGKVHDGHLGVNKCLHRAAMTVWWPGITTHQVAH